MSKLKILNKKELKKINHIIEEQYGAILLNEMVYLLSEKERLYMVNRNFSIIDDKDIKIDSIGLYLGTISKGGFRLSIEGSQLLGPFAKKNVITISNNQFKNWLSGEDINLDEDLFGPYIIKCNNDFGGSGFAKDNKLLNHVPKERRIR